MKKTSMRRYDIDWVRMLASYLVVFYHTAQFFDFKEKTYIKNGELSWFMDIFTQFVHLWHMPLFFVVAGWSSKSSIDIRGVRMFLLERAKRLGVPLLFGLFALCTPESWVALKHGLFKTPSGDQIPAQPNLPFITFLHTYYYNGGMSWSHLWFLAYLFTFSVVYLPGFWLISRLACVKEWIDGGGGLVLGNALVFALATVQVTLRDRWPGYQNLTDDWANFGFYSIFFITGFCLAQYPVLEDQLLANWKGNLLLGVVSCCFCLLPCSFCSYQSSCFYRNISSATAAWYTTLFLLSYARWAYSGRAPPPFWAKHAFPVYVVHNVPLSLLADALLRSSDGPILIKAVLLAGFSLLLSLSLLTFLPTPMTFMQPLIGMKMERSKVR